MSEEAAARWNHVRALSITSTAALAGVVAAIAAAAIAPENVDAAATSTDAQIALLVAVIVQLPVYQVVFDDWGGAKDVLYVVFMTFIMWFVTYGVILSSGAQVL